jgi:signal-transduction protein with cAMP-binding, CBS, and nucleotidyltransferase domain
MRAAPLSVDINTSCGEAVRLLRQRAASSLVVTDAGQRICGIVTERDVVRRITYRVDKQTPVRRVMSSPVVTIQQDDYLFRAIALMRRMRLRHIPVLDAHGSLSGMLDLHEALGASVENLLALIDRLTHEESLKGLKHVKAAQVELAQSLMAEELPAPEIQALLTHINNDIYRRIVIIAMTEMADQGWGEPPVGFDVIIMGSGGRNESFLFPDQDNGFVLEEYPDTRHAMVDTWFIELAERMTRALDAIGIRSCKGYVMATNPLWRKHIVQWCQQVNGWFRKPNPNTLRLADIFFDFNSVYGEGQLAASLHRYVTDRARKHPAFLREMERVQESHGVALGLFRRLTPDNTEGPHKGKLNLKYHGLLPLVECIRLLSLREGIMATSTLTRIDTLHENGVLNSNEQDYLSGAFHHITYLILRQQVEDFLADQPVGPYVPPSALSEREKDMLVAGLVAIDELSNRVRTEFTGDIF